MKQRPTLMLLAAFLPLAATLLVVPFRDTIANTNAALVLVLVIVAVAAQGDRFAGTLAALSAGLWFDVLLTQPYQRLTIARRADAETTLLLLAVGVAVTELAVWGRRQQADASRRAGYEEGIRAAVGAVSDTAAPGVVVDQVCSQITRILHLDRCRFDYATGVIGGPQPRLRLDGQVEIDGIVSDVDRLGLPVAQDIELLITDAHGYRGRFVMTANAGSHPTLSQRLVAITLADRAARVLATEPP